MSGVENKVISYFEGTRWDYRHLWRSDKTGALHFGYYDWRTRGHVASLRRMTSYLASLVGVEAGDYVMDAGCGLGGCAIWLAQNRGCRVTGVNITPFQVVAAREAIQRAGLRGAADVIEADVVDTGLPARTFDVVWALESVVHVDDKAAFLAEAHRVLKPGGRLMIAEYLLRDVPDLNEAERADLQIWTDGWVMPRLLSDAEYGQLLEAQRFDEVKIIDISRNVVPSLRRLGHLVRLLGPTAPMFERLGILSAVPAASLRASAAQIRAFDTSAWSYKVVLARKASPPSADG